VEQRVTEKQIPENSRFSAICKQNGVELGQDKLDLLDKYVTLLLDWNQKVNLISRANTGTIWFSHILHSILPLFFVEIPEGVRLLDLGSGGGLPGVPISIVRPDIRVTHLDSVTKKCKALLNILSELGLPNSVINSRVEEVSGTQTFDHIIARAVAPLSDLIRWSRPLVTRGGGSPVTRRDPGKYAIAGPTLLALKGGDLDEEIQRAKIKTGIAGAVVVNMTLKHADVPGLEDKKLIMVDL
jgi:16S rRNA (guanine527-N7)-methyltransferase